VAPNGAQAEPVVVVTTELPGGTVVATPDAEAGTVELTVLRSSPPPPHATRIQAAATTAMAVA
jgi:hypothetical protein